MRPYELIVRKRDGGTLTPDEIRSLIAAYTKGDILDYQMSSMLMAVFFRGLDEVELTAWADAMLRSGEVLDLSDINGIKVDKHSTGGVGDKVSLPLAPLAASLGVIVPMVSGRGLGHTGGTLDKLESIPGFRVDLSVDIFRDILKKVGVCMIGQTAQIAPADKKLYALRDVTGTVESIPLIASSIMSKKLAEGMDALVLDVKVGRGAFMKEYTQAKLLAQTMITIGTRMGKRMRAYLTTMEQPLGFAVGNALELVESIEVLQGKGPKDLVDLTVALGAEMVVLAQKATDLEHGKMLCTAALQNGKALACFREMVELQGGDPRTIDDPRLLPSAPVIEPIIVSQSGYVIEADALEIGLASVEMGAGRAKKEDNVDPAVGIVLCKKIGDAVQQGEPLAMLHHRGNIEHVKQRITDAFRIATEPATPQPLFLARLAGEP
jgi:pyrimidine-nucleoside phosphorylase